MKHYSLPNSLERLTSDTLRWLEGVWAREEVTAPVILWSGGKDSMVMLHLLRFQLGMRLPVVLFREPWWPEKYAFHDELIAAWGLEVYSPPPLGSYGYEAPDGHMVLMARYGMRGQDLIDVPKDVVEFRKEERGERRVESECLNGGRFSCGAEILNRPKGVMEWPWDVALIGHKDCDVDPVLGRIPLKSDYVERPEGTSLAFPLKGWSDREVWDYLEAMNVPMDTGRYDVGNRTNWEDRSLNSDWIHGCARCLTTSGAEMCFCPKWNREIPGMREKVVWAETLVREHFNAERGGDEVAQRRGEGEEESFFD